MSTVRPYEVAEISELRDFLGLESEWNGLLDESQGDLPFLRHEWLHIWWKHFGAGKRLSIVVARRDGRLAFAMPLHEERVTWLIVPFVTLRSITNAHSFRYHLLLRRGEEESVRAAWQYLATRRRPWHMLELERFETGLPADRELVLAAERAHHPVGVWTGGESPYLRLEGTWEGYLASRKQKFRANLRNRLKRLHQMGTLEYELIQERSALAPALDDAFAIERSGWKGEQGSAIAQDPALRAFYTEYAERAADLGWLRLWFLKLNGKRIAFEYDLEYKRILYCMKIGYEPELQPYAVGQVLKAGILERAFQDGLREYNFLGVMDEAKRGWTSEGRPFQWLHVYNGSVLPRLHHAYKFALKQSLKRVLHR